MNYEKSCDVCCVPFQAKSSHGCYCSKACYTLGNRRKNLARFHRKASDPKFREEFNKKRRLRAIPIRVRFPDRSKPCLICGIDFKPKQRFSTKYCSPKCTEIAHLRKTKEYRKTEPGKKASRLRSKIRLRSDPHYRLNRIVGRSVWGALKRIGKEKSGSTFKFLPYSPAQLKAHLESFFNNVNGFTWENHGKSWQIDHIIPQSMFRYTSMDSKEFRDCWSLTNLMPVNRHFNTSKNCRFVGSLDDSGQIVFLS